MYSSIWSKTRLKYGKAKEAGDKLLYWREHCIECAPPLCYQSCPLYENRGDDSCRRIIDGIQQDTNGVKIVFKKWGKIESRFINMKTGRSDKFFYLMAQLFTRTLRKLKWLPVKINKYYDGLVERVVLFGSYLNSGPIANTIEIEAYSPITDSYLISIQGAQNAPQNFKLNFDDNQRRYTLPFKGGKLQNGKISILNLSNHSRELVVQKLNIFYKELMVDLAKVKVVVWDLDNTVWDGIVGDDNDVYVRRNALECIKLLDQYGVLNSISSKNTHSIAWQKIKALGLNEYFLHSKINWNRKSDNIRIIAQELNIGLDSVLFIDDNPSEREEVQEALPEVQVMDVYLDELIDRIKKLEVTNTSHLRRKSYQSEILRKEDSQRFVGDYHEFLKKSSLTLSIRKVNSESDKTRLMEMFNRTNQFNLRKASYTDQLISEIMGSEESQLRIFSVEDKYGNYGIVGGIIYRISTEESLLTIIDYVQSCRVAQKSIEEAIIKKIMHIFKLKFLKIEGRITPKNTPLLDSFDQIISDEIDRSSAEFVIVSRLKSESEVDYISTNFE